MASEAAVNSTRPMRREPAMPEEVSEPAAEQQEAGGGS